MVDASSLLGVGRADASIRPFNEIQADPPRIPIQSLESLRLYSCGSSTAGNQARGTLGRRDCCSGSFRTIADGTESLVEGLPSGWEELAAAGRGLSAAQLARPRILAYASRISLSDSWLGGLVYRPTGTTDVALKPMPRMYWALHGF